MGEPGWTDCSGAPGKFKSSPFLILFCRLNRTSSFRQFRSCVYIVARGTTQGIKIDALVFKPGVLGQVSPVTAGTGFDLGFPVDERVRFDMHRVAGRAVDRAPVVSAADKLHLGISHALHRVTAQAGLQLFISRRRVVAPAKLGEGRKTPAPVCAGYMNAAGAMAGFAAMGRCR